MTQDPENFDPELKAALKRVAGGHLANPELRQRIAAMLDEPPAEPIPHPAWRGRMMLAAAVLMILIGAVAITLELRQKSEHMPAYVAANGKLLDDMIAEHDTASPPGAEHLTALSDAAALQSHVSKRLGRPVPLPDLSSTGWQLTDAMLTTFHSSPAARFNFTKGDKHLTLLSLPPSLLQGTSAGETYETGIRGHTISGYVTPNGLHCLIADPGVPAADVTAMRDQLRKL